MLSMKQKTVATLSEINMCLGIIFAMGFATIDPRMKSLDFKCSFCVQKLVVNLNFD